MPAYILVDRATGQLIRSGSCPAAMIGLQAQGSDRRAIQIPSETLNGGTPDFDGLKEYLAFLAEGAKRAEILAASDLTTLLSAALSAS